MDRSPASPLSSTPRSAGRRLFTPRRLPPLRPDAAHDVAAYRAWWAGRPTPLTPAPPYPLPAVAVVVALDRPRTGWLRRSLRSVAALTWPDVEVVVVGEALDDPSVADVVTEELGGTVANLAARSTGAAAAVEGVGSTEAPLVLLLGQHDELEPGALHHLVNGLVGGEAGAPAVYGDEDEVDDVGAPRRPWFKPDWSPELLLATNYVGRPLLVRRAALEAAGGVTEVPGGDWEHDLVLRLGEQGPLAHVPEVLVHRHAGDLSTARLEPAGLATGPAAVERALARSGEEAEVVPGPLPASWTVRRRLDRPPRVTLVVCFRDNPRLLRACTATVTATTTLRPQLVLVDNGSVEPETLTLVERLAGEPDVTVLHDPRPFNWAALNNRAVELADGQVLVFLNDDIEARRSGWLEALVAQAVRPDVGAVGARLLYPDGRLQHAGVVIGLGGAAGHVLAGLPGDQPGYAGMAVLAREVSGVTGACLATRRSVFDELGGFDESLGLDLNDVDYCLRAIGAGYRVLYEPGAELVHHESPTRGTSGSAGDIRRFVDRWADRLAAKDPLVGAGLTRVDCSCALCAPDESAWWQAWRATLQKI